MAESAKKDYIINHWISDWLLEKGIPVHIVQYIALSIDVLILLILSFIAYFIAKKLLLRAIKLIVKRSKTRWDDILLEKKVFNTVAHIVPAIIIQVTAPYIFSEFPKVIPLILQVTNIYIIAVLMVLVISFLSAVRQILGESEIFKDKPIDSYFQLGKIIIYIVGGILILSVALNRSPSGVLTAFGAMAAILMFVFKDTILGLVASVQLSANDMVRVGDWVEMPKYGADGDVMQITLNTVKVQNWDKTISTIPTYAFISDSFKNWRAMQESGGRRIKRSLNIKISSIKFCTKEMLNKYMKFQTIADFIKQKADEIEKYNQEHNFDKTQLINGRHLTNVGIFRQYAEAWLRDNPNIKKSMTLMVRQLRPTELGLPIEIYCFTKTTEWIQYERIQADIFDHLLAAAPQFDLEVFQNPSGMDFGKLGK